MSPDSLSRFRGPAVIASLVVLLGACGGTEPPPPPPPATLPPATPAPTPVATATPDPVPPVTVAAMDPPKPAGKAVKPGRTAPAPKAVAAAEAAVAAGKFDEALKLYERAAVEAPQDKRFSAAAGSLRRRFVPSLTESWSTKDVDKKLTGFEAGGVAVKRVPETEGRLDFVVTPPRVRPGDRYRIDIHLTNAGKKAIKVDGVTAVRNADGKKEGGAVRDVDRRSIESRQRERIATLEGTWAADTKKWVMDVRVAAASGDAYEARLRWE